MSETSDSSCPRLDPGDNRNLLASAVVADSGHTPQITSLHARTDLDEAMTRQGSAAMPPSGDSPADQSSLIRNFFIREELRSGLGSS